MTVSAPAAIALAMSPDEVMPPSAITGTPCRSRPRAQSKIAVTCGTPTPATTRVVQIAAGADADLDRVGAGVDQRLRRLGGRDVAGDRARRRDAALMRRDHLDDAARVPVRRVDDEHVDLRVDQRAARARARPGRRRRRRRRAAGPARPSSRCGYSIALLDVLDGDQALEPAVARRRPAASRSCAGAGSPRASSSVVPTGAVTRSSRRHQRRRRGCVGSALEAEVAVREDADEAAVVVGDRDAGDAVALHQRERVGDERRRAGG